MRDIRNKIKKQKPNSGFTIIEVITIVVVIGILATIITLRYNGWRQSVITAQLKSDLNGAEASMENARTFGNVYPSDVSDLTTFSPSDNVVLSGGSMDGATYCISASSLMDASVYYFITNDNKSAREGSCPELVDAGFEGRADGTSLDNAIWTDVSSPQKAEYDTAQAKVGTVSALVQGPAGASAGGAQTPVVLTADGSEIQFWLYFDTANQNRYISDTASTFELRPNTTGQLTIYTKRTATGYTTNGYTQVGTYATGWMQYRIVLDFSTDTYQLSQRASTGDAWMQLKAAGASVYDIPMREVTDRTTTAALLFRGYQGSNLWLDGLKRR